MRLKSQQSYPSSKKGGLVTRIFGFALSSFAALGVAFFVNAGESPKMVSAESPLLTDTVTTPDFSSETEADPSALTFALTASSLTETTNSFKVTATSGSISTIRSSSRTDYDSIYVIVEDGNWTNWETARSDGEAAVQAAEEAGQEFVPATYSAYVYNIHAADCNAEVIIPEEIRGPTSGDNNLFILNIVGIHADACATYSDTGEKGDIDYGSITSITIPDSVITVDEGAFPNASGITFNLEASQATITDPESQWASGWTDSTSINYDSEYSSITGRSHPVGSSGTKRFGVAKNFCIGSDLTIDGYEQYYQPMWISYDLVDDEGNVIAADQSMQQPVTNELGLTINEKPVGGVDFVNNSTLSMNVDIPVHSGAHVDPESVIFHNIYGATNSQIGQYNFTHPVLDDGPYFVKPSVSYSQMVKVSDYFTFEAGNAISFGDHIAFPIKLNINKIEAYQKLRPSQYRSFESRIKNGTLSVRILFDSLSLASYRIVYENNGEEVTSSLRVTTPISYSTVDNGSSFTFLINKNDVGAGFSHASLKELYFEGFNLKIDLFDYDDNAVETGSFLTTRFGSMSLLPAGKEATSNVDLITIMIWVYVIFVVASAVIAFLIYIYRKNKFKNDEFRRVNGKRYIKEALKKIFGCFLIVSSLMFIIFRWGFLNNSIVVYNPVDIWVIIFTVAGGIALGLFIKDAVVAIKLNNERKRKARLHIDEDVVDDGTK